MCFSYRQLLVVSWFLKQSSLKYLTFIWLLIELFISSAFNVIIYAIGFTSAILVCVSYKIYLLVPGGFCFIYWLILYLLRFSTQTIISTGDRDTFIFPFPIYMPLTSISWLITLARTSNMLLNRNSEHAWLVANLKKESIHFSLFGMILTVDFLMHCIRLMKFSSIPSLLGLFFAKQNKTKHVWVFYFLNTLSAPIDIIMIFLL